MGAIVRYNHLIYSLLSYSTVSKNYAITVL